MSKHLVNSVVPFFSGIVALVIAVFHAQLKWLFYHPKLKMTIDIGDRADCHQTIMRNDKTNQEALCYYFRLRVHNRSRFAPAHHVEVFIENIECLGDSDGTFKRIKEFLPMNLIWAYFKNEIYYPRLSPRSSRHCGFAHIVDPGKLHMDVSEHIMQKHPNKLVMILDVFFKSNMGSYIFEPGEYRINLSVSAADALKKQYALELGFYSGWTDNEDLMLSNNHISINIKRKRRLLSKI
jgi:hypothetical protein